MILIPAKIRCDHYSCDNVTVDVELEFREGAQGIPILSLPYLPGDWRRPRYNESGEYYCPKHPTKDR